MPLEAIQEIQRAEQAMQHLCDEATAVGKQLVSAAERDGMRALEDARHEAQAQSAAMIAQAQDEAAHKTGQALAQAEQACQALRQEARQRLDRAAVFIVERVVKESCPSSE